MKQDIEKLSTYYTEEHKEQNRISTGRAGSVERLTTLRYLNSLIPKGAAVLDACAGYGVYAFELAGSGYIVTAGDLVANHVAAMREKQAENPILHDIYNGNICDLSRFGDGSFDAVLNLGAFYHMTDKSQREQSLAECVRVLKPGGLFFMAYLSKFSNYIKYCEDWKDDSKDFVLYLERGHMDDDSLFYTTTPEDVEVDVSEFGIEIMKNIATDGLKFAYRKTLEELSEETYNKFLQCHYEMCERRSLLGYSEHGLIVGRKL